MKRMALLAVLAFGLLAVVTDGTVNFGVTVAFAQVMGQEYVPPMYECEDDFGKYESSFPCDMEGEACSCITCHTQVPCDEMEAHKLTHGEEFEPTDPENPWENDNYPPIDAGGGSGGGSGGGTGGGSWNSGSSSSYATGKAAFDKMEADFKSGNYEVYEAEIISEGAIGNIVDVTTKLNSAFGVADYLAQQMADLSYYENYVKFAKANVTVWLFWRCFTICSDFIYEKS